MALHFVGVDVSKATLDVHVRPAGTTLQVPNSAAMSGVRCNPTLRTFYTRLVDARKPRKAALTAVAHKLLTILNTMARAGTSWAPPPSAPARQRTTVAR